MPTIGDATEVVREEMPAPKMEEPQPTPAAADSLETAMKNPPVRWVSTFLETMPKVNYPISLDQLAKMVQESYLKRTMQPSYVVKDTKPGAWIIDGAPKNNVRLGIREFAPNVRSVKMKKRMYTKATYARRELLINSLLGVVVESILREKDCKGVHSEEFGNVRGNDVVLAMLPTQANAVTLMWEGGATSLDPMANMKTGIWLYKSGGGWLEVDATVEESKAVALHESVPGKQHLTPKLVLEQAHMAMTRVKEQHVLENMATDICEKITAYNELKKREAKRLREKKRKNKKKKKR
jgi:hypothetical protein